MPMRSLAATPAACLRLFMADCRLPGTCLLMLVEYNGMLPMLGQMFSALEIQLLGLPLQVKGKGLVTRVIFALAFRWKQLRIKMGAAVESVSTCFRAPLSTLLSGPA
jgi:hypothetical protein